MSKLNLVYARRSCRGETFKNMPEVFWPPSQEAGCPWGGCRFVSGKDDETNKDQDRQNTEKHQAPTGKAKQTGNRITAKHESDQDECQQNDDDNDHDSPMLRHLEHRRKAAQ